MRFPPLPVFADLTQTMRHHGVLASMLGLAYRVVRRLFGIRICYLLGIDIANLVVDNTKLAGLDHRFLSPDEIRSIAVEPSYDLDASMADRVANGSAMCFAMFEGSRLVNYSWYSLHAAGSEDTLGMKISFPNDTAYIFKVFTHPDYRGRRIHSLAILRAFEELTKRGLRRVVGIIEFANWPSVRSHIRLGGKKLAYLMTIGQGPTRIECFPPRLAEQGLRLGREAVIDVATSVAAEK